MKRVGNGLSDRSIAYFRKETGMSIKHGKMTLADIAARIVFFLGLAATCFHLYVSATGILEAYKMRTTHLMFLLPMSFLIHPTSKKGRFSKISVIDFIWFILTLAAMIYISQIAYARLIKRIPFVGKLTTLDLVAAVFLVVAVLEATRRVCGLGMVIVCLVAIAYAFGGKYLTGKIRHTGTTVKRMAEQMSLSTNGIFGSTVAASATYIFMFTLFGEFLEYSGAGQFFIDMAFSLTGKSRGGPAKMAVVASGLMGMISGSSTANVTSTGTYTIPLMKKTGYRSEFAGAVEASASTGGQIMPPVMGAASFLLAEYVGINYIALCAAAAIPAVLYFAAVFIAVHFEATRIGLKGMDEDAKKQTWQWLLVHKGYLALPIVVILVTMILGFSAYKAALYGILSILLIVVFEKKGKISIKSLIVTLAKGGRSAVMVAISCAAAGIVIGVSNETGIGVKFASIIINLGRNNLYLILAMVMLACIFLGMGLPTSACYIMVAAIAVPALIKMGCNTMACHLFALYFGIFSGITPPVAISAYAAAGLAKSPPMKTGWLAVGLSLPAFIIPYAFIFNPALILEGTVLETVWVIIQVIVGIVGLASAVIGCAFRPFALWERAILLVLSAVMMVAPSILLSIGCMAVVLVLLVINKIRSGDWQPPQKGVTAGEN